MAGSGSGAGSAAKFRKRYTHCTCPEQCNLWMFFRNTFQTVLSIACRAHLKARLAEGQREAIACGRFTLNK